MICLSICTDERFFSFCWRGGIGLLLALWQWACTSLGRSYWSACYDFQKGFSFFRIRNPMYSRQKIFCHVPMDLRESQWSSWTSFGPGNCCVEAMAMVDWKWSYVVFRTIKLLQTDPKTYHLPCATIRRSWSCHGPLHCQFSRCVPYPWRRLQPLFLPMLWNSQRLEACQGYICTQLWNSCRRPCGCQGACQ